MESTCSICCNNFTNSLRKEVKCNRCSFVCCSDCVFNYNNTPNKETNCMSCKEFIFLEELKPCLSNGRLSQLKKQLKTYIFTEESKLFTDTKLRLAFESKKKNFNNMIITKIGDEMQDQLNTILAYKLNNLSINNFKQCSECEAISYKDEDSVYYECKSCKAISCSDCEKIIQKSDEDTHECKGESLKSLELINKETKPCPSCGTNIFKSEGCSQIMCSKCHTFFNFNTGKKESETEQLHAAGYINMFYELEKKVVPVEELEAYKLDRITYEMIELWEDIHLEELFPDMSIAKVCLAVTINIKSAVLNLLKQFSNMNQLNYDERVSYIVYKIYKKEEFICLSYKNFIMNKKADYTCKVLTKLAFYMKKEINTAVKLFLSTNSKKEKEEYKKILEYNLLTLLEKFTKIKYTGVIDYSNFNLYLCNATIDIPCLSKVKIGNLKSNVLLDL